MKKTFLSFIPFLLITSSLFVVTDGVVADDTFEFRGNLEFQQRIFSEDPLFNTQPDTNSSIAFSPEFYWVFNDGNDTIEFVPFARWDQNDDERTHGDIRELSWIHVKDDWETRIGVRRVFWGVTEFQHLVDIINQFDAVEDIDNEDKLGQPMINFSIVKDWGILDLYLLPYFRERTFAGAEGRPGIPLIDTDNALFESTDEENHIDIAARWAHSIGEYEVAVSIFDGTSRDPLLIPDLTQRLTPYYQQITQVGLELQANLADALWKLEVIHNDNAFKDYFALQGGVEYTQYGIMDSNADLGWLVEYGYDHRGDSGGSNFQNDLFIGNRLAFNDVDSSELLFGIGYDLDFQSTSVLVEGAKRFGNNIKVSLDVRLFESDDSDDPLYLFRRDDHVQLTAQYFF